MDQEKNLKDEIISYALRTGHLGAIITVKTDLMDLELELQGPKHSDVRRIYDGVFDPFEVKSQMVKATIKKISGKIAEKSVDNSILEHLDDLDVFVVDKLSDVVSKYIEAAYSISGLEQLDFFRAQPSPTQISKASNSDKNSQ